MSFSFPKIYPILDSSILPASGRAEFLRQLGASLADAGVTLLEYRNKIATDAELLADAAILRGALSVGQVRLILDDRADLVEQAGFDGAHVDRFCREPGDIASEGTPIVRERSFVISATNRDVEAARRAGLSGHVFDGGDLAPLVHSLLAQSV